jgi:hypothetical protein
VVAGEQPGEQDSRGGYGGFAVALCCAAEGAVVFWRRGDYFDDGPQEGERRSCVLSLWDAILYNVFSVYSLFYLAA